MMILFQAIIVTILYTKIVVIALPVTIGDSGTYWHILNSRSGLKVLTLKKASSARIAT